MASSFVPGVTLAWRSARLVAAPDGQPYPNDALDDHRRGWARRIDASTPAYYSPKTFLVQSASTHHH